MKKYLLLALPVVMAATPAMAQLRVEGVLVYDKVKGNLGSDPDLFNPVHDRDFDVAYGVGLGYDFVNLHGVTAGADVEFTESTAKRFLFDDTGTEVGELKIGTDAYVGGRLTAPITGNFSVVGTLGYTALKVRFDSDNPAIDNDDDRISGYRAGLGFQYGDSDDRTYYGAQYRYSNYSDGIVRHQLGLVVGARFGRRSVAEVIAPAAVPAPVPAPEPVASQTCADGSVILATDTCPAVAPPQPVGQPERG
jgi:hypothetical protein